MGKVAELKIPIDEAILIPLKEGKHRFVDEGEYIFDYDDEMIDEIIGGAKKALKLLHAE